MAHAWTLAIEEQFYLLWPVVVLLAGRRWVALVALVCAAASAYARGRWYSPGLLLGRADGLALGGMLAAIHFAAERKPNRIIRLTLGLMPIVMLGALAGLGALGVYYGFGFAGGFTIDAHPKNPSLTVLLYNLIFLGAISLVVRHSGRPALAFLRLRPLQKLGLISYGLYLYHFPLLLLANHLAYRLGLTHRINEFRILALVAAVVVASLSWRYIESPVLELKRRFAYRPKRKLGGDVRIDSPQYSHRDRSADVLDTIGTSPRPGLRSRVAE